MVNPERRQRLCLPLVRKAQLNSPLSVFEISSVGFQHRVDEPDVWASSFHVWLDFHHVALSRCRCLLVGTECKYVDDSKSLNRASSCVESFGCTRVTYASTASSSPGRCCFLGLTRLLCSWLASSFSFSMRLQSAALHRGRECFFNGHFLTES